MIELSKPRFNNIENSPLWKKVSKLVEDIYSLMSDFPEEEKWYSGAKLKAAATDLLFVLSQALGSSTGAYNDHDWSMTRRAAVSLKSMYRFCGRQKFVKLDPEVMILFDEIIKEIDHEVLAAHERSVEALKKDVQHSEEKYRRWSKMNRES